MSGKDDLIEQADDDYEPWIAKISDPELYISKEEWLRLPEWLRENPKEYEFRMVKGIPMDAPEPESSVIDRAVAVAYVRGLEADNASLRATLRELYADYARLRDGEDG
jgi:hypothetical protein